jgi:effector-binding domain-containing protein
MLSAPSTLYAVEAREVSKQPVASIRITTTPEEIGPTLGVLFSEVLQYLESIGVAPSGPSFTRYYEVRPDYIDLEAGFLVAEPVPNGGRVKADELPAGTVAVTWHIGPYDTLHEAYPALQEWMNQNGRTAGGPSWEFYWSAPDEVPDPTQWQTEIFWPLKSAL